MYKNKDQRYLEQTVAIALLYINTRLYIGVNEYDNIFKTLLAIVFCALSIVH